MTRTTQIIPETPDEVFVPVDLSVFADGLSVPFDIYARDGNIIKFLFSKNSVFCGLSREILSMQSLTEFFIRERDVRAYDDLRTRTASSQGTEHGGHALLEAYSDYKAKTFVLRRDLITPDVAHKLRLGIMKFPSFGEIPLMEDLAGEDIVERVKKLEYDIVIPATKLDLYEEYVESLIRSRNAEKQMPMRELIKIKAYRFFRDPSSDDLRKKLFDAAGETAEFMLDNKRDVIRMTSSLLYDFYLYVHSVNVMLLSVVIGSNIGIPRSEIMPLAIGAILHDLGKTAIENRLIDKAGVLSATELNIYRSYAHYTVELLGKIEGLPKEALEMAAYHRDKLSPEGIKGRKTSIHARIVELVNAYDTMVSNKAGSPKMKPFEALNIIKKEKDNYDQLVLKTFVGLFG